MTRIFIFLASLLLPVALLAQSYFPFPMDSATWSVEEYTYGWFPAPDDCIAQHYGYGGDTLIGGLAYSKLYGNNLPQDFPYSDTDFNLPTSHYVAAVREDGQRKVWLRMPGDTADVLYYDFALDSGDTFCFDYFGTGCYPVAWVDSIWIAGSYRRQVNFLPFNTESWIEGIGSTTGWFHWQTTGTQASQLLCYQAPAGQLLYEPFGYCHCDTYTGLGLAEARPPPQVYPLPAREAIWVKFAQMPPSGARIELRSVHGSLLKAFYLEAKRSRIDLSYLPAGFYLLAIEGGAAGGWSKKVLKLNE